MRQGHKIKIAIKLQQAGRLKGQGNKIRMVISFK
jgi:hypothetical protein